MTDCNGLVDVSVVKVIRFRASGTPAANGPAEEV